jgi:probable HAF family extracellular repeat protein
MRSKKLTCITAMTVFVVVAALQLFGQKQSQPDGRTHYRVISLNTLGGPAGSGNGINNLGWVSGTNITTSNTQAATLWLKQLTLPLGTLGGPNSSVPFPAKDDRGVLVGISDTTTTDPLGENFCAFGSGFRCSAFWWQNGKITGLPTTLGGNNSRAAGADNHGHVIGWAETGVNDSTCIPPAVLQYVPVVWNLRKGDLEQLPTLSGDPDGAAVAINEHNQIVGISGPCGDDDGKGARHAVLWENGTVTKLPDFGGQFFNTAAAINNHGMVAGWSDVANDTNLCNPHCYAFIWTQKGGIEQVGPLPGDANSLAYGINEQGQVVGQSLDSAGNSRAFLWQDGKIRDLNSLVARGSPHLLFAGDINDRGEITGETFDQTTNQLGPAYLAVPSHGRDDGDALGNSQKVILPESVRQQIRRQLGLRLRASVKASLR